MQVATSSRPPEPGVFDNFDAAIRPHIRQRIAEPREILHLLLAGIGEAATGELAGAFQ